MKIMTNKELQQALAIWPDEYYVCVDKTFGWDIPDNKNKVNPHLWINSDVEEIEIGPYESPNMNYSTVEKIINCINSIGIDTKEITSDDVNAIKDMFNKLYE